MYPYDVYGYDFGPYDDYIDDRQAQVLPRLERLEVDNRRQVQELTRINNEILRINQEIRRINQEIARMNQINVEQTQRIRRLNERLRVIENRMNIPFMGDNY